MRGFLSERIARLEPSATGEIDNSVKEMRQRGVTDIVSLGAGEPCFDTPENIVDAACTALRSGRTKYHPTAGDYDLREEISRKLKEKNHIEAGVDEIIVTPGGKFAIYLAFQAVLEPGDRVAILDPAWVTYEPAARMAGGDVVRIPTSESDGFEPDPERIRQEMDRSFRIVVINSPCNPTGTVFNRSTIHEIAEIARDHGALLLSDEIYEYIIYEGEHYSPGSEFDNVITVNGFSKSHAMTGWRLGYVTGPKQVLEGMIKIYQHSVSCVTAFAQAGAIEALRSEASKRAARQMLEGYRERRALMVGLIDESEFFECRRAPQGTFYCFPSYRSRRPSVELSKALLEQTHVATVPGAAFGECGEGHVRLSYATSPDQIHEAFRRMEAFFRGELA
ncbi:MAG: pyridoxal phosphate-dependent aminotransferase [Deltaproteobacteria bacterium]|nr:pyridoxal phosphate-dependent aminotransferase [Deltaproteobacteria bacterium]